MKMIRKNNNGGLKKFDIPTFNHISTYWVEKCIVP